MTDARYTDSASPDDRAEHRQSAPAENPLDALLNGQRNSPLPDRNTTPDDIPAEPVPQDAPEKERTPAPLPEDADDCGTDAGVPDAAPAMLVRLEELLEDHRIRVTALLSERAELEHVIAGQEARIDTLSRKVEELNGNQVHALLLPPASRLVDVLASLRDTARRDFSDLPKETVLRQYANELEHVDNGVTDAVRALGLTPVICEAGEKFSSRFHQATGTTDTTTADLDKRIARVIRPGFTFPGAPRPSIAPQVVVYRYVAPAEGE